VALRVLVDALQRLLARGGVQALPHAAAPRWAPIAAGAAASPNLALSIAHPAALLVAAVLRANSERLEARLRTAPPCPALAAGQGAEPAAALGAISAGAVSEGRGLFGDQGAAVGADARLPGGAAPASAAGEAVVVVLDSDEEGEARPGGAAGGGGAGPGDSGAWSESVWAFVVLKAGVDSLLPPFPCPTSAPSSLSLSLPLLSRSTDAAPTLRASPLPAAPARA